MPSINYPSKLLFDNLDSHGIDICCMCDQGILGAATIVLRKIVNRLSFEEMCEIKEISTQSAELRKTNNKFTTC